MRDPHASICSVRTPNRQSCTPAARVPEKSLSARDFVVYCAAMLSKRFTLTKRHLGLLLLIGGAVAFVAILGIDVLDVGREGGIGPAQRMALGGCVLLALVGLTLIPIRDQLA